MMIFACLSFGISGCQRSSNENSGPTSASSQASADDGTAEPNDDRSIGEPTTLKGWAIYSPPENDFSVMAPENSVKVDIREEPKFGKWRKYAFKVNETSHFAVTIHTERTGALAGNSVEEVKADTSDILPGSLKDISLGDTPGVEFRMKGAIGESVFREYCPDDNSRTVTLHVAKDLGDGLTDDEVRLFLDSFKLLD